MHTPSLTFSPLHSLIQPTSSPSSSPSINTLVVEDEVEVNDKFILDEDVEPVIKRNNDQFLVQRSPCNQVRVSLPVNEEEDAAPFISTINKNIVSLEAPCFYLEQDFLEIRGSYPFVSEEDASDEVKFLKSEIAKDKVDTDTDGK